MLLFSFPLYCKVGTYFCIAVLQYTTETVFLYRFIDVYIDHVTNQNHYET